MKVYFVTTGLAEEIHVLKKVRPPRILCSYWYFKNKPLGRFCKELGYCPEILLDSGAYSAHNKGKNVNLLDYREYIKANERYLSGYISLDVIGDPGTTWILYYAMRAMGLRPVPVVHYGEDLDAVKDYMAAGGRRVALGDTVRIKDKKEVSRWCAEIKLLYPDAQLHLLGSCSTFLTQNGALAGCDSSTWYLQAVNGRPAVIPGKTREAKLARAEANMRRIMEVFNEDPVPFTDCGGESADR